MKKKRITILGIFLLTCMLSGGCSGEGSAQETGAAEETSTTEAVLETEAEDISAETENAAAETETQEAAVLPDGIYTADFDTDSSMFRVNEACDGKGTLTVENGEMTIHVSLMSKKIVNLYLGLAEDAAKDGAVLLMPTEDMVTYSDGITEEVYGFDIPVPALDEEFDLALIGTKGTWYDHKVSVSNPEPLEDAAQTESALGLEDGTYTVELTFEGGSGKAQVSSPATVTVEGETVTAVIEWSSPNYDYMIVDGETYLPVNTEGNSVFEIPVLCFDEPMEVIGDTVAMSKPYEIEYTLTFHSDTMKLAE